MSANGCGVGFPGFVLKPNTEYTCRFTGQVFVTNEELQAHENTVTIRVTDTWPLPPQTLSASSGAKAARFSTVAASVDLAAAGLVEPTAEFRLSAAPPKFAEASADATVLIQSGGGSGGGGGGGGQPPTDMLIPTDSASAASGPLGDPMSWILWVLLTASVILSAGLVVRRVRYAESHR
jgi:hypothetical protein